MNTGKLDEIYDRIQTFSVEEHYEPGDLIQILNIMENIVNELRIIKAHQFEQPVEEKELGGSWPEDQLI